MDDLQRSYDRVAAEYTRRIFGELADKPFDRALLDRFADLVRPVGSVCDVGCGPGHVARYLHERGLPVMGIDLSPGMIEQARRLNPELSFHQGSMLDLPLPDDSLGGIAAFYSVIHVPPDAQPRALAEMRRVLRAEGRLLVAFHLGDERRHLEEWWDMAVSLDFYFFQLPEMEGWITDAGFAIEESVERDPYPEVEHPSRRGYILARKPRPPNGAG